MRFGQKLVYSWEGEGRGRVEDMCVCACVRICHEHLVLHVNLPKRLPVFYVPIGKTFLLAPLPAFSHPSPPPFPASSSQPKVLDQTFFSAADPQEGSICR